MSQIHIYSTERPYLRPTVHSMVRGSSGFCPPIPVYASGSGSAYADDLPVTVVDRDEGDDALAGGDSVFCASLNMRRAVLGAAPGDPLYLCEDDVEFSARWFRRSERLAAVLERTAGPISALSLFFPYGPGSPPVPGAPPPAQGPPGGWFLPYPPSAFYGSLCLRLSGAMVEGLRARLTGASAQDLRTGADMVLKSHFEDLGPGHLFGCHPSLAQHVGDDSTQGQRSRRITHNFDGTPPRRLVDHVRGILRDNDTKRKKPPPHEGGRG